MQALEVILRQNAEAAADAEVAKLLTVVPVLPDNLCTRTLFGDARPTVVSEDFVHGDKL